MAARLVRVSTTPASCNIPDSVPVPVGSSLVFGRSTDADVFLDSTEVRNMISRKHAKVVHDPATNRVTLFDLQR